MKLYRTGRVLAALLLGTALGCFIHQDQMRWLGRGRDAFLAYQDHRFGKIVLNHSATGTLISAMILAAVAFGVYELVAAGITSLLPPGTVEE